MYIILIFILLLFTIQIRFNYVSNKQFKKLEDRLDDHVQTQISKNELFEENFVMTSKNFNDIQEQLKKHEIVRREFDKKTKSEFEDIKRRQLDVIKRFDTIRNDVNLQLSSYENKMSAANNAIRKLQRNINEIERQKR